MSDEKTLQGIAQDAGELVRNEMGHLRDSVAVGLSTARSVGEQLLNKVSDRVSRSLPKRARPAAKKAKRVVRKAAKRGKTAAKSAKRKGAAMAKGARRGAKRARKRQTARR